MFTDELAKIDWDETTAKIAAKTDRDVRRALGKEHCDVEDFMALISPAAEPYLETMAALHFFVKFFKRAEDQLDAAFAENGL